MCGQPQQLLQLFRSTLDDEPFQKLLEKLSSMASNPMVQQVHVSENTNSLAGLSLRAGGRGFSPATKRVAPGYFYWKIEEKQDQKKSLAI